MIKTMTRQCGAPFLVITLSVVAVVAFAQSPPTGQLFPEPFLIEHQIIQTEIDGSSFATEPVVDHYGGSWVVSVRPDGSRLIVDFSRRDMTEVRPERGTYTVISFDRFGELQQRLQHAENPSLDAREETPEPRQATFEFSETGVRNGLHGKSANLVDADLLDRPSVRRMTVTARMGEELPESVMDVWFDPEIRLPARALEAVESFESAITPETKGDIVPPSKMLAAARIKAGGALVFRTQRVMAPEAENSGTIEDVATRIEPLTSFPVELLEVSEGLRRAPHPLELMVEYAEEEAELRSKMSVKQ